MNVVHLDCPCGETTRTVELITHAGSALSRMIVLM